jgi:hypothetical protein
VVLDLFASGEVNFIGKTRELKNIIHQISENDSNEINVAIQSKVPVDNSTGENCYYNPLETNWSPSVAGL